MKAKLWVIVLLVYGFIALAGCTGLNKKEAAFPKTAGMLEPSAIGRLSDIPVPAGFKYLPVESYSFENLGLRVGVLKYQGKADADRVVSFYREQMPMYSWNLVNITEYGDRLLNFERENESCIVALSPKGRHISITISLGPKSPSSQKKAKEPVK